MKKQREETFLRNLRRLDSKSIEPSCLIIEEFPVEMTDEERIEKLKRFFWLMSKHSNDKAAAEFLTFLEEAYRIKEENIAEGPGGNKHLGNAHDRANRKFRDYLMEIYWQLSNVKRAATGQHPKEDELRPTMLKTKYWILEQIANDWRPKRNAGSITEKEAGKKAFEFLVKVYNGITESNNSKNKFRTSYQLRLVSKKEKGKIIELIRSCDSNFKPEELEEWMQDPNLPYDIEKTLAIARTRNGGPKLWQRDIQNAEILKLFSLDERTPTAIELYKKFGQEIANLDNEVKTLIAKMQKNGWAEQDEIGASEYVTGIIKFELINLTAVIISVQLENGCPKELGDDIYERANRHIDEWEYRKEKKIQVELKVGEEKDEILRDSLWLNE